MADKTGLPYTSHLSSAIISHGLACPPRKIFCEGNDTKKLLASEKDKTMADEPNEWRMGPPSEGQETYWPPVDLTERKWFAGMALVSMGTWTPCPPEGFPVGKANLAEMQKLKAEWAYQMADIMIAEGEKRP